MPVIHAGPIVRHTTAAGFLNIARLTFDSFEDLAMISKNGLWMRRSVLSDAPRKNSTSCVKLVGWIIRPSTRIVSWASL